jgi:hypothetical protein
MRIRIDGFVKIMIQSRMRRSKGVVNIVSKVRSDSVGSGLEAEFALKESKDFIG